ncbi:hypothetical protein LIER_35461 [Lithospermum erythrorhizon]|uniref:Uncharacterized protein n=1 Tax=Lithospermum erythrorhizon TaxID=34254 RepID=A0AAV3NRN0_LITER
MKPVFTPLKWFTGQSVYAMGEALRLVTIRALVREALRWAAKLDLTVGEALRLVTIRAFFTVVDTSDPSYNGLLGGGIGEVIGDRKKARVYYQFSIPRGMCLKEPPRQKREREG